LRLIYRLVLAFVALWLVGIPGQANPIVARSQPALAPPFRLPAPPFQTQAQTEAGSRYWRTHSIPWPVERQTAAEAAASRYWQTHPTYGHQGQPGFVPRYDPNADMRLLNAGRAQPNNGCPLVRGPNPQILCCKNGQCDYYPDVVAYTDCLGAYSCVWGSDSFGNHPWAGGSSCRNNPDGCSVGVHKGNPSGSCDKNSAAVGDNLGFVGGKLRQVVDTNEIFRADGLPFRAPDGSITVPQHIFAFVYKDQANNYWIQINPGFTWTPTISASVNAWGASFGLSLNAPTGTPPQGPLASPPGAAQGEKYAQCFTNGNLWG